MTENDQTRREMGKALLEAIQQQRTREQAIRDRLITAITDLTITNATKEKER